MFLATALVSGMTVGNRGYALLFMGAYNTHFVIGGEVWRMVTSAFLHGDIIHLALNMYALLMVGTFIERFYGRRKLITIYIFTAIFGCLATLITEVIEFSSGGSLGLIDSISIGASGSLFGMIGVLLGNRLKRNIYEPQLAIDTQQLVSIVVYNLVISLGLNFVGGAVFINVWAHVGGLIGGLILGLLLSSINAFYIPKWRKVTENILFIISVIIFLLSFAAQIIFIFSNIL